jgi:hypothetical protein
MTMKLMAALPVNHPNFDILRHYSQLFLGTKDQLTPGWPLCNPASKSMISTVYSPCPWAAHQRAPAFLIHHNFELIYLKLPMLMLVTLFRCCIHNINQNLMKFSTP